MKTYTFIIGSSDDFESIEGLMDFAEADASGLTSEFRNYSSYEFAVPANLTEEDVTMIGRGFAFSNDWSMDDSFSFMIEGPLHGRAAEDEFVNAGIEGREKLKEQNRSDTQSVDPYEQYNSNDPVNW